MILLVLKRFVLPVLAGVLLGWVWHKLVGCRTGSCPLMATPLRGMLYGGLLGLLFALSATRGS